jgi:hypothetical protein
MLMKIVEKTNISERCWNISKKMLELQNVVQHLKKMLQYFIKCWRKNLAEINISEKR